MSDIMLASSRDKVSFSRAVRVRLHHMVNLHRQRGTFLVIPKDIEKCVQSLTQMHQRYKKNRHFHTLAEEKAEELLANWLIDKAREFKGLPPATNQLQCRFQ